MDKDVENLLESWQLSAYKSTFTENNITLETLSFLDSNLIKELIGPVGDRARFSKNLAEWIELTNSLQDNDDSVTVTKLRHSTTQEFNAIFGKNSSLDTPVNTPDINDANDMSLNDITNLIVLPLQSTTWESPSTSSSQGSTRISPNLQSSTSAPKPYFKYTGLKDLLKETLEGRGLLTLHSENGLLSNNGRRKICNLIIKHILEKDPEERVSSTTLLTYAQQITTLFRQENISTYFVPYLSNTKLKIRRLAKGKLYDCLQNRKKEYRVAIQSRCESKETNDLNTSTGNSNQDPAEVIEDITWLKNSCDPWASVVEKWIKTREFRHEEIIKESHTIESYMNKYPALKKPAGFHLLVSDFTHQYPGCTENLKEIFPLYKQKILDLAVKKYSKHPDQGLKAFTEEYIMNTSDDDLSTSVAKIETTSIYALMFLPLLLGNPVGKNKKSSWRPSKQEARDAFVTHVAAEGDLMEAITRRKEKYVTHGLTFQPTMFIVGPSIKDIKKYYLVVNDTFYVVNSIVEAVDVTFKLFFALHCEFPTECCTVYSFLQKGFYKLSTKWDREFTAVNSLLADLDIK